MFQSSTVEKNKVNTFSQKTAQGEETGFEPQVQTKPAFLDKTTQFSISNDEELQAKQSDEEEEAVQMKSDTAQLQSNTGGAGNTGEGGSEGAPGVDSAELQNKVKPKGPKTVDSTKEALDHYFKGNGEAVRIGTRTAVLLVSHKDFLRRHMRIIKGQTTSMSGHFNVDMTFTVFHIGRTNVNYTITRNGNKCTVTYELFANDGFWDPDFIDEKILGRLGLEGFQPDGPGPNLERFGGTPYHYIPTVISLDFDNPGYK